MIEQLLGALRRHYRALERLHAIAVVVITGLELVMRISVRKLPPPNV